MCFLICILFYLQVLHTHMDIVDKLPITTGGSPLQIHCKNFMCITFVIPKERDCHDIYTSLKELSKPGTVHSRKPLLGSHHIGLDKSGYLENILLFLDKNICCGYSLEASRRGASNEYPQHMFSLRNKKNIDTFLLKKVPYQEL